MSRSQASLKVNWIIWRTLLQNVLPSTNAQQSGIRSTMSTSNTRPRPSTVTEHLAGTKDAWHGKITPDGPFKPEKGRYYLYIGLFCPFAHRVNIVRHLKNLQTTIPLVVVRPYPKGDNKTGWPGWKFPSTTTEYPGATPDPLHPGREYLHELYFSADAGYEGRYSVPVLWDSATQTIVNNESTELVRDLAYCFDDLPTDTTTTSGIDVGGGDLDFYPPHLRAEIDRVATYTQRDLNTGVYKAGFADLQADHEEHAVRVFATLNRLENLISRHGGPFVLGRELTELDIRLYPTIVRFDAVYVQHFKCNLGTVRHDYPVIHNWMKGLFWGLAVMQDGRQVFGMGEVDLDAVARGDGEGERGTVDFTHIKENYTKSHYDVNPKGLTPLGPWPHVESGYESDFSKVKIGGVSMPRVLEMVEKLEREGS